MYIFYICIKFRCKIGVVCTCVYNIVDVCNVRDDLEMGVGFFDFMSLSIPMWQVAAIYIILRCGILVNYFAH